MCKTVCYPDVKAVMQCERCGKPICEADNRKFYVPIDAGNQRKTHYPGKHWVIRQLL